MSENSARNLDFLRWKHGTHEALSKQLEGVLNWKELSDFALGQKPIPKYRANSIEERLSLPVGWLSRDNLSLVDLSATEHELVTQVLAASPKVKVALAQLLAAIGDET